VDRSGAYRQSYRERRALVSTVAVRLDRSTVHLHEMAHDRESESEPAMRARTRGIPLPECIEDVRQKGGIDAAARVADAELVEERMPLERDRDRAFGRREFDGIRQQVPHDLLEPIAVS
jgi:hypothetical protein